MPPIRSDKPRRVLLLGSTGSIGTQTLDAIEHLNALHQADPSNYPDRFEVVGLVAGNNRELLAAQAAKFRVAHTASGRIAPRNGDAEDPAVRMVREVECEVVVAAMVGASGLPATLAAVEMGRDVALANKETLVAAGSLIIPAAKASGSRLLPVDSEHSAVWQCLQGLPGLTAPPFVTSREVSRIILTASGGALRKLSRDEAYHATPQQALAHPTWNMGAKVTLDSASLTNKAFEVIEAHWLFGLEAERIDVLIHPQSIVHSMVEHDDGSVIAQLGSPDMRGPIQYALTHPARPAGCARKLDFAAMTRLDFEKPSLERFPALALAYRVIRAGGTSGAIFNAASEEATLAFLSSHSSAAVPVASSVRSMSAGSAAESGAARPISAAMPFGLIPELAEAAMNHFGVSAARNLADILEADEAARRYVRERLER